MSRQLPSQPHIDVVKKQAKALLSDHQAGQAEAVGRVSAVVADLPPGAIQAFSLRHAQQVLAREYGFSSWQAMADHIRDSSGEDWAIDRFDFYRSLAGDLADSYGAGDTSTYGILGEEMGRRMRAGGDALEEARAAISWLAGCQDWAELGRKAHATIEGRGIVREQLSALERQHEEFVPQVAARLGAPAHVAFVDYTTVCEFVISIGRPSHSFRCTAEGVDGPFVIDVGLRLADGMADGGAGVVAQLLGDLPSLWPPVPATQNPSLQAFSDPFAIRAGRLYDTCVLVAYEVETEAGGVLLLCYPEPSITKT